MDWIGDYLGFCLHGGFGGLVLLGLTVMLLVAVVMTMLTLAIRLGRSFTKGLREGLRAN